MTHPRFKPKTQLILSHILKDFRSNHLQLTNLQNKCDTWTCNVFSKINRTKKIFFVGNGDCLFHWPLDQVEYNLYHIPVILSLHFFQFTIPTKIQFYAYFFHDLSQEQRCYFQSVTIYTVFTQIMAVEIKCERHLNERNTRKLII